MPFYVLVDAEGVPCWFRRRSEALAAREQSPGGRILKFFDRTSLDNFLLSSRSEDVCRVVDDMVQGVVSFMEPTFEDRIGFLTAIQMGDFLRVKDMIRRTPALLIDNSAHPRKFGSNRVNALHVAARCGSRRISELILSTVGSYAFVKQYERRQKPGAYTQELAAHLLDYYLNGLDTLEHETPLHQAVRYGWLPVVRLLIAYPQCEMLRNIEGQYPHELICRNAADERKTDEIRHTIAAMLREAYFVPLLRTESDLEPPSVGRPFSRKMLPNLRDSWHSDKLKLRRTITAFAGPMTLDEANRFYKEWKTAPRLTVLSTNGTGPNGPDYRYRCSLTGQQFERQQLNLAAGIGERAFRRTFPGSAMERLGRSLALLKGIGWKEYWPFLGRYACLSKLEGLQLLEQYLNRQAIVMCNRANYDTVAIGGQLDNPQNIRAIRALNNVPYDAHDFPYVKQWQSHVLSHMFALRCGTEGLAGIRRLMPIMNIGRICG